MKRIIYLLALALLCSATYAQDLLVTDTGDTLNCKITKVKPDYIYFSIMQDNDVLNTLLPANRVVLYQKDYFSKREVPVHKLIGFEDFPHFRLAANAGYSYRINKIGDNVPDDFKDYVNKLKSGYHFGGEASYFFTPPLGMGFRYYSFRTSNSMDGVYFEDEDGNAYYGTLSDEIAVSFIGPSFSTRIIDYTNHNSFIMSLAIGYMGYVNHMELIEPMKMTGNTLGMALDISYDLGLSESLALGFRLSLITGNLFKYDLHHGGNTTTIELEEGEYEGLSRIDFSVGLRFNK